jgi:hypothetical protein
LFQNEVNTHTLVHRMAFSSAAGYAGSNRLVIMNYEIVSIYTQVCMTAFEVLTLDFHPSKCKSKGKVVPVFYSTTP